MTKEKEIKILTLISLLLGFILVVVGTTYSLLSYKIEGTETNLIKAGCFKVEFVGGKEVSLSNAVPMKDEEGQELTPYDFTIKNSCDIAASYKVMFAVSKTSKTGNEDKIEVSASNGLHLSPIILNKLQDVALLDEKDVATSYILGTGVLTPGKTKTISVRTWIDYDATTFDSPFNYQIIVDSTASNGVSLTETLLGKNNQNVVTTGDGLYKEEYTPSSELSSIYQSNLSNGNLTTYYYKGTNVNNYVSFAGLTWRVIRINEDGSIRLILNDGIDSNTKYTFNPDSLNEYAYMYYSNSDVANGIKSVVDSFYSSNLSSYANYIEETTFCEEAKVKFDSSYTAGSAEMVTKEEYTPSFDCKTDGNGKGILRLNIGLITIDEYLKSGGIFRSSLGTSNSYLAPDASANAYWTMSPAGLLASQGVRANAWSIRDSYSQQEVVVTGRTIRPVISLKTDTLVTSLNDGSSANPYQVIE